MKKRLSQALGVLAAGLAVVSVSYGHHSFAVHYDSKKVATIEGVAKKFRFTNPHGILELEVKNAKGEIESWTVETTAPVYMSRRGWSKDTIKPGDRLVVEGWPARDGSHLMRIRKVRLPDGTELGQSNPSTATGE
jgi:vancomycin resistance protein YoaR